MVCSGVLVWWAFGWIVFAVSFVWVMIAAGGFTGVGWFMVSGWCVYFCGVDFGL